MPYVGRKCPKTLTLAVASRAKKKLNCKSKFIEECVFAPFKVVFKKVENEDKGEE